MDMDALALTKRPMDDDFAEDCIVFLTAAAFTVCSMPVVSAIGCSASSSGPL